MHHRSIPVFRFFHFAFAIIFVAALLVPASGIKAKTITADKVDDLMQFTSNGYVLGFDEQGIYLTAGSYMLREGFSGTAGAAPVADQPRTEGQAQPLSKVRYSNLWDGIDVEYDRPQNGIIRSTFHLAAGADPTQISLQYNVPVSLDESGNLLFAFESGSLRASAPVAWQVVGGQTIPVEVSFIVSGASQVGFELGDYDPSLGLSIDPTLSWNTFLGTGGSDSGTAIAVDSAGNVYVAGNSNNSWGSPLNPHSGGSGSDAFAAKLDSKGALLWHTFWGTPNTDLAQGIAVDGSGNIYVTGFSRASWGTPIDGFGGGAYDAFLVKLDNNGNPLWHTFLGGGGDDRGNGITLDGSGNPYVTGESTENWGSPIRPFPSSRTAFVASLDSSGNRLWNTFLGGAGADRGYGITLDGSGAVYVTGNSSEGWGTALEPYEGSYDAFAAKLNASGALQWHTFIGSTGEEWAYALAVDGGGDIYVTGSANAGWGSPVNGHSGGWDAFIARLDNGGAPQWHTFAGSSGPENGFSILVDSAGMIIMAGDSSGSWGNPVNAYVGSYDAILAAFSDDGNRLWNTFTGSSGYDSGKGLAIDNNANFYITGQAGGTWGSPVRSYSSGADAFVVKLSQPSMDVQGQGLSIANGSSTPVVGNNTDFGNADVDGEVVSHVFSAANAGPGGLALVNTPRVAISGAHAADFTLLGRPYSPVDMNNDADFVIQFDPSGVGLREAVVSIMNNDSVNTPYTFNIQGTGTDLSAPEMDVSGNAVSIVDGDTTPVNTDGTDFGDVATSGTASQLFRIENTGNADLSLTGSPVVAISGTHAGDFVVSQQAVSPVTAGSTDDFIIDFTPSADGVRQATVSIANDDGDENPYTFDIQGNGVSAPVVVFGTNTFPSQNATLASGISHITVEFNADVMGNAGLSAANHVSNYLLFSDGGDGFQTISCAGGVAAGDVNIPVNAASYDDGDEAGPYIVSLSINDDTALPGGSYRLLACGTTSIENHVGLELNNGSDTEMNFTIQSTSTSAGADDGALLTLPATGFAPGMQHKLPKQPVSMAYTENGMMLSIPKLDVNMPVVGVPEVPTGWDVTWLGEKAGYLSGTAYPTWVGNTVITGHVWDALNNPGPFAELKTLVYGDRVQLQAGGRTYVYEVRESRVISPEDIEAALQHEEFDWVTLVTCESYNTYGGSYDYRRMVRAVLVEVK